MRAYAGKQTGCERCRLQTKLTVTRFILSRVHDILFITNVEN